MSVRRKLIRGTSVQMDEEEEDDLQYGQVGTSAQEKLQKAAQKLHSPAPTIKTRTCRNRTTSLPLDQCKAPPGKRKCPPHSDYK